MLNLTKRQFIEVVVVTLVIAGLAVMIVQRNISDQIILAHAKENTQQILETQKQILEKLEQFNAR